MTFFLNGSNTLPPLFQTKLYKELKILERTINKLSIETENDILNRF